MDAGMVSLTPRPAAAGGPVLSGFPHARSHYLADFQKHADMWCDCDVISIQTFELVFWKMN